MAKTKEEQQKELNEKRALREKQLAQLKASNEMLEMAKKQVIEKLGEDSESAKITLKNIDIAEEQNLERAATYLNASKQEVESIKYNKVSPQEEKAYYERLERQGKKDADIREKDLTKKNVKTKTTNKKDNDVNELAEKLKMLETNIMNKDENPTDIEQHLIKDDIVLEKNDKTFEEEMKGNNLSTTEKIKLNNKTKQSSSVQKSCKDFDPRDVPSYVQYDIIPLPSKGECYPHKKDRLPVAYLTAADENLITSPNLYNNGSIVDLILERKILDKSIRVSELSSGDRDAIVVWLRATAYGKDYPIIASYNDNEIKSSVDLSELEYKKFTLKGDENGYFDYKTENGDKIKFKFLSKSDEIELTKKITDTFNLGAAMNVNDGINLIYSNIDNIDDENTSTIKQTIETIRKWFNGLNVSEMTTKENMYYNTITNRMIAHTVSINGNSNKEFIEMYINNMRTMEAKKYREYIEDNTPGIDFNITVQIPESQGGGSFETFLQIGDTVFINV